MTRAEIRAAVITALRESTPPVRWTTSEIARYIDDGYRDLAERTASVVRTVNVVVPAGVNYVELPTHTGSAGTVRCLFPIVVKDVTSDLPLDPVHWSFIDGQDAIWARTSSSRPTLFALWDWLTLLIYPKYSSTGTLAVTMAVVPDGLPSDSSEPEVPPDYHDALIAYVHWRCLLKGAKGPRFGRAMRKLGEYSERIQGLGQWTQERHEGIFTAIYGQKLRVPGEIQGVS